MEVLLRGCVKIVEYQVYMSIHYMDLSFVG